MAKLTDKQQCFVKEYLVDLNATQAAIRAGYSARTAEVTGCKLLRNTKVASAISIAQAERAERTEISQDWVLETIYSTVERCKQARPVLDKKGLPVYVETPDGKIAPVYAFDSKAVLRGAELAGKHLGMFVERHEHTGPDGEALSFKVILVKPKKK